jgi:hypothetical protein
MAASVLARGVAEAALEAPAMSGAVACMHCIGQADCMASSDAELGYVWLGGTDNGTAVS